MPRLNLPQKSISQAMSKPTPADQKALPRPSLPRLPLRSALAVACCSCGYSALPAMPSWARASMMRMPAVRTPGLTRCASATIASSVGSPKARHQSSSAGGVARGAASASVRQAPPGQSASHGTGGRAKSGPTVVQPASASAAAATLQVRRPGIAAIGEAVIRRALCRRRPLAAARRDWPRPRP